MTPAQNDERVPPSIPADASLLAGALRLLDAVESLPPDASGALRFGSSGTVLVQGRRVCWAMAAGMQQRLTEILRRQRNPPLPREFVDSLFRECKETGTHLGEALLSSGEVTPAGLRVALFRHTAEAIAHIARAGADSPAFIRHSGAGYDARFVFSTPELLSALGGRTDRALAARAQEQLSSTLVEGCSGAAFVREEGASMPVLVAVTQTLDLRVAETLDVCTWAAALFDLSALFDPGVRIAIGRWRDARSVVTWRANALHFVAPCATRAAATLLTARLEKRRRAGAVP